jgi:hypothetical protein
MTSSFATPGETLEMTSNASDLVFRVCVRKSTDFSAGNSTWALLGAFVRARRLARRPRLRSSHRSSSCHIFFAFQSDRKRARDGSLKDKESPYSAAKAQSAITSAVPQLSLRLHYSQARPWIHLRWYCPCISHSSESSEHGPSVLVRNSNCNPACH